VLENRWNQLARNTGGKAPEVDWVGLQREIEIGLQRRLRRELQVEPLIICLVQPAPAGTPAYKGRSEAEPDPRPAPRERADQPRDAANKGPAHGPRDVQRPERGQPQAKQPAAPIEEVEPSGRARRRRSAAMAS
jgi:ribonuclease J